MTSAVNIEDWALKATLNDAYSDIAALYSTTTTNSTQNLINSLVFASSKSVRTSTVILATFNILAALGTALSILHDSNWIRRPVSLGSQHKKFCTSTIHPAETFPLIQAIGIILQGLVFAVAQGTGLKALVEPGCRVTSQFMFPAIFLVGYIQIIFGLETVIRALRSNAFQPRGKYNVGICLVAIVLLEVGTWLVSFLKPTPDQCFASLVWFTAMYPLTAMALCSLILGVTVVSAAVIFIRLSTVSSINEHQRIAASRMVYYLVVGFVSMAFVIPFYILLHLGKNSLDAAMVATVVLNLSGLMTGLLQLFLRANTATSAFKPKGTACGITKHDIRIWGPNELSYGGPMSMPAPSMRYSDRTSYQSFDKKRIGSINSDDGLIRDYEMQPVESKFSEKGSPTITTPSSREVSPVRGIARTPSYSIFPAGQATNPFQAGGFSSQKEMPTSVYDITNLVPPPLIFDKTHRRKSSVGSTATVQIGLRLSHAPVFAASDAPPTPALPASLRRPQLQLQTQNIIPSVPVQRLPSPVAQKAISPKIERESLMKTLPAVPHREPARRQSTPAVESEVEEFEQLSPLVYKPAPTKKTLPTPLRVSALLNSSPTKNTSPIGPPRAAPGTVGSPLNVGGGSSPIRNGLPRANSQPRQNSGKDWI